MYKSSFATQNVKTTLKVQMFEFIGVIRHIQRYFSHICDGTDVHAD